MWYLNLPQFVGFNYFLQFYTKSLILFIFNVLFLAPESPSKPVIFDKDTTEVTLVWLPPDSLTSNCENLGYNVDVREESSAIWKRDTQTPVFATHVTIGNLIKGKKYDFRVAAVNDAGQGTYSEQSEMVTAELPGKQIIHEEYVYRYLDITHQLVPGKGGTHLKRGYGDVQPSRPPLHTSPAAVNFCLKINNSQKIWQLFAPEAPI